MSKARQNDISALAGIISEQDDKRRLLTDLRRMADDLQRGGLIAASGEMTLIRRLEERLTTASQMVRGIGDGTYQGRAILADLRGILEGPEWVVASETLLQQLQQKVTQQQTILAPWMDKLASLERQLEDLSKLLADALKSNAPVREEQRKVQQMVDSVTAAKRARQEQNYRELLQTMEMLDLNATDAVQESIKVKIKNAERFSRQADLLLIQSPLDGERRRYHYTMLLRTASAPGSQGINIQDSSTLVKEDRDAMASVISQVTEAIGTRLQRNFTERRRTVTAVVPASIPAPDPPTGEVGAVPSVSHSASGSANVARNFTPPAMLQDGKKENLEMLLEDMGDLMFRLFMPEWTQAYLKDTPCSVMITTNDLELPWELMYCNGRYLCLDRPISRMPMGRVLPVARLAAIGSPGSKIRFLLIHSDPAETLSHAKREIETLERKLKEDWQDRIEVVTINRGEITGQRLNKELRHGGFDVIHYAGHAAFDSASPELSGLLVGGSSDKAEVYFAQKIRRLLKGRPLVFLNACESGTVANEDTAPSAKYLLQPAEGLASAFLYGGALACIGSLWPIYDEPAAEFALEFYRYALEGHMLGEAMRLARVKIREKHPNEVTWAAFALYGDATFRLA